MKPLIPSLALTAALLAMSCPYARADDPGLQAIIASWDDTKQSGKNWLDTGFSDDANKYQEVVLRQTDIDKVAAGWRRGGPPVVGTVPLFHLKPASAPPDTGSGSKVKYFQSTLSAFEGSVKYKGPRPERDYSDDDYPYELTITRPGTSVAIKPSVPGNSMREARPASYDDDAPLPPYLEMVVLKPVKRDDAAESPFTALADWPECSSVDSAYFYDRRKPLGTKWDAWKDDDVKEDPAYKSIVRAFLPEEVEIGNASGLAPTDDSKGDLLKVWDQISKESNRAAPYTYAQTERPKIRTAAAQAKTESEGATAPVFTAFEYRFLACRAQEVLGGRGRDNLTSAVKDAEGVKRWRAFVQKELDYYMGASAILPGAKPMAEPWSVKVDFDGELAALKRRTIFMFAGKSLAEVYAPPAPPAPPETAVTSPQVSNGKGKVLDNKMKSILDEIK
jgi:hypothetical protein